jgi:hypothetical protein
MDPFGLGHIDITKISYVLYFYLKDRASVEMVDFDLVPLDFAKLIIPLENWEPVTVYGIHIRLDDDGHVEMEDSLEPSENFFPDWLETFGDTIEERMGVYKKSLN